MEGTYIEWLLMEMGSPRCQCCVHFFWLCRMQSRGMYNDAFYKRHCCYKAFLQSMRCRVKWCPSSNEVIGARNICSRWSRDRYPVPLFRCHAILIQTIVDARQPQSCIFFLHGLSELLDPECVRAFKRLRTCASIQASHVFRAQKASHKSHALCALWL